MAKYDWLLEGESVLHEFDEIRPALYLTDRRVLAREGGFGKEEIWEVGRQHVSGASSFRRRMVKTMMTGGFLFALGIFLIIIFSGVYVRSFELFWIGVTVLGIALMIAGALLGPKGFTIYADGGQSLNFKVKGWSWESVSDVIASLREERQVSVPSVGVPQVRS